MRFSFLSLLAVVIGIAIACGFPKGISPIAALPLTAYANAVDFASVPLPQISVIDDASSTAQQIATSTPVIQTVIATASVPAVFAKPKVATTAVPTSKTNPTYPSQLVIPSINLTAPVQDVGVNSLGEMDVPSGSTNNVGWYKAGTIPGTIGSAVMDAHVFAEFSNLKSLKIGDDVYVTREDGSKLHFKVTDIETYQYQNVPAEKLFAQSDAARLNLITCAGSLTPDHSTYDHRLVVYTELVN